MGYIKSAEVELLLKGEDVGILVAGNFSLILLANPLEILANNFRGILQPFLLLPGHFGNEVNIEPWALIFVVVAGVGVVGGLDGGEVLLVDIGVGLDKLFYLVLGRPGEYLFDDVVEFVFGYASGGVEFVGVQEESEGGVEDWYGNFFELRGGDQGLQEGEEVYFGYAVLNSACITKWWTLGTSSSNFQTF